MDQQIIEKIVDAIVEKLVERSRKLLVLFTGSPLGMDEVGPALEKLHQEGYTFTVFATEAGKRILDIDDICARLDAEKVDGISHPAQFLDKGHTLIVPTLTQNTAVKWALGINDSLAMDILADGVQRGYSVVACTEGCCPNSPSRKKVGLGNQPEAYKQMMQDRMQALRDYGIRLATPKDFYGEVREATRLRMVKVEKYEAPKPVADPVMNVGSSFRFDKPKEDNVNKVQSKVITLSDIITLKKGATVELDPKAILTPSAREFVRDMQIVIVRRA